MPEANSPAELASKAALEELEACLENNENFLLEAGAGAGKTYSLVKALQYLIKNKHETFVRKGQRIACITFTNVAKDEIESRTDRNPIIFCDTNHAFCWQLIKGFQAQLRKGIAEIPEWNERIEEAGGIGIREVDYSLGYRSIKDNRLYLHHNDVITLCISLMKFPKFRKVVTERFPIILIDEYQDTDADWIESIKETFLNEKTSPLFGFFGDHWQKIYGNGCGKIEHPSIKVIGKKANFRSVNAIVKCLNRIRPELPQFVKDEEEQGEVRIFHTNDWNGKRQGGAHWSGDLPLEVGSSALANVKDILNNEGWEFSSAHTKILMLTHRLLAAEQGYSSLTTVFRYNEAFTKKEHPYIAYFVDELEPACDAYKDRKFGVMFDALGRKRATLKSHSDKVAWNVSMQKLMALRLNGTVGDVVNHLRREERPRVPDSIEDRERELASKNQVEITDSLSEIVKLKQVAYSEIRALYEYHNGYSPFETKHGVKGAEFENVLVVIGRGWNQYNFGEMLELARAKIPQNKQQMFERNRNLFYVCCSRPKRRLALLFTQELSASAISTIGEWFGSETLIPLTIQ